VDFTELKALIAILEGSRLKKLAFKKGDFSVELEKESVIENAKPVLETMKVVGEDKEEKKEEIIQGDYIVSPMVGTFYTSPAPNQPSFVKVNDDVKEDTVVCIIEAMKVMNEVKANKRGTVKEILVESGHPVEFGTKLFRIE